MGRCNSKLESFRGCMTSNLVNMKIDIISNQDKYFQDVRQSWKSGEKKSLFSLLSQNFGRSANCLGRLHTGAASNPWIWAKGVGNIASRTGWCPEQHKNLGTRFRCNSGRSLQESEIIRFFDTKIYWSIVQDSRGSSRFSNLESAKSKTTRKLALSK